MKYIDAWTTPPNSFWEEFPYFRRTTPFKELYTSDRSNGHHKSSKLMWFIALNCDLDSEYYTLQGDERFQQLSQIVELDVLEYKSEAEINKLSDAFTTFIDTPLSASVRQLEAKLAERSKAIAETPYVLVDTVITDQDTGTTRTIKATASQLDSMFKATESINALVIKLRKDLRSQQSGTGLGGSELSFSEE